MHRTMSRGMQGITMLLLAIAVVALSACGGDGGGAQKPGGPTATPKPISNLDFAAMRQQRKDAVKVEDWEKYRLTLIGQRVQWTGRVLSVAESKKAGLVDITVDMDPTAVQFSYDDVVFLLPQQEAAGLAKGQPITLQGDITEIAEMKGTVDLVLTVTLDKVTIVR